MEPIRINVEVSLSEATLEALRAMTNSIASAVICNADPTEVRNFCKAVTGDEPEAEAPAKPEKDCRIVESSTVKEEPEPESAQVKAAPVSDENLMNAVKTARRERGVTPAAIKALFKEYGIGCSKDCPESKRSELMSRILSLTA